MRKAIIRAAVAAVAALSLGTALVASTEPAAAQFRHGGGFGGGGWHGGGWGGGWRGGWGGGGWRGGWGGGGWRGGWGGGWRTAGWGGRGGWGGYGWRGGYYNGCGWGGCGWNNGWWWPVVAGVAAGAVASYPYWGGDYGYGNGYGYDNGCVQLVPVYSRHGHYLGRRWVNVCS